MPGVYISFPFCSQKCTFCNFASGVLPRQLEREYLSALQAEIAAHPWNWVPETLYLGGGTPSQIATAELRTLLAALPRPEGGWLEATIEAAPGSLTDERAAEWARSGINRVSLGVQSFAARELAGTGRKHRADTVVADVALLARHGITNLNIDLIAGLPGQTTESWRESLDWIEKLAPAHVSVYMLEVDEDSRLGKEILSGGTRYGAAAAPPEELIVELYEYAVDRLAALGLPRYEISNFARPGFESVHNLKYWRMEPYVGFGADAHSFDGVMRRQNAESAADYVNGVKGECVPARVDEERLFTGLRLLEGVRLRDQDRAAWGPAIARRVADGLVEEHAGILRLTRRGVLLSNEVFAEFVSL